MDELMRHQPSLKQAATAAIIKLLEQVCSLGRDPKYVCWKSSGASKGNGNSEGSNSNSDGDANNVNNAGVGVAGVGVVGAGGGAEASSDEEEEEEVDEGGAREEPRCEDPAADQPAVTGSDGTEKEPVPLVDYVLNVMKFVDAILSNNSTDDHCREFVSQKGLVPLMGVLGLPNLPVDFPVQPACQSVAAVCKSILNLAHEPQVLKQGLLHLKEVLNQLEPLHLPVPAPGSSVLLHELVSNQNPADAINNPAATPLLHHMSAAHAYITMFVHVCRTGQADIRTISVSHWGSELGLQVLESLSRLYTSLVWESTVLLALCSEDNTLVDTQFGKSDMEKLLPGGGTSGNNDSQQPSSPASGGSVDSGAGVTSAMEQLTTDSSDSNMDTSVAPVSANAASDASTSSDSKDKKTNPQLQAQIKQIKPLLSGSSRLGRALAELFGLLVKLCVGSPLRQRRGQQVPPLPSMPSPPARAVATALTKLLTSGLSWAPPSTSPLPKFRLTFFICSVGFTSPMLFDEKKFPYHLMLYQFVSGGGQKAFFDAFYWAITLGDSVTASEGLENPGLPERTGEFLDAWLMLLEKMVNPKNVLESPHMLPDKAGPNFKPFDTLTYLIKTHKTAFEAVMHIWGKKPLQVYGWRMSESVLSILCHILKGETLIKERLEKEKPVEAKSVTPNSGAGSSSTLSAGSSISAPPTSAAGSQLPASGSVPAVVSAALGEAAASADPTWAATSTPAEPDFNPEHLQTLMDMGFRRERCIEAMQSVGGNLDAATDYLLTPVTPLLQSSLGGPQVAFFPLIFLTM
jgi:E3 ubiquitin-protein ligase HUWE1